jgi:hypothetical protein
LVRVEIQHAYTQACAGRRVPVDLADWLPPLRVAPNPGVSRRPAEQPVRVPRPDEEARRRQRHRR